MNTRIFSIGLLIVVAMTAATTSRANAQTRIMPLGDSITRGVDGPSTDDAGYRNDLDALLTAEGVSFDLVGSLTDGAGFDSNHEGHDGFRADELLLNIGTYLSATPDIIILHIGTNDVSNGQSAESTRDEIEDIIDTIHTFDPTIKIILSSIVPRIDGMDNETTTLNTLIEDLFYKKRDQQSRNLYYAGMNELYKQNPSWATAYFDAGDDVHPNDAGHAVAGETYFNAVMTALNSSSTSVTDNFERTNLGTTWSADPEFAIQGGDLVNTAITGTSRWEYLATYRSIKNPNSVAAKWAADADADGIDNAGLALLLDAASANASGYLAWISASANDLHLWTITSGTVDQDQLTTNPASLVAAPVAGAVTRVEVIVDPTNLKFDYYVNDAFAGSVTIDNPGLSGDNYAGVVMRHDKSNDIDEFTLLKATDTTPPDAVSDLIAGTPLATSVPLSWLSTGDDAATGIASRYDMRYSTQEITVANFESALQVLGLPDPLVAGTLQEVNVTGLQPGRQYFFVMKVIDEAGNESDLSNQASATTVAGNLFTDNFNRSTGLGDDWVADPAYDISNNRLTNTSSDGLWDDIAVLTARKNPVEVSFKLGENSDADGIDQTGFVIVFDAPSPTASGYAVTRRTADNSLRLWRLVDGAIFTVIDKVSAPLLAVPEPGDVVKIQITADGSANKFDFFINGVFDGRVEDIAFEHDLSADSWAGVTLRSNLNNDIDDFTVLLEVGAPASLVAVGGDAQVDTVGQQLPEPLCVKVVDENDSPIQGINVTFEVLEGGGSVDVTLPSDDIVVEAESGTIHSPMSVEFDANASNEKYIEVPNGLGGGGGNLGSAEYLINIDQAGDYVMWGRAIFPDAENDAFRIIVGGQSYQWDVGQRVHSSNWQWDAVSHRGNGSAKSPQFDPLVFSFEAGIHTLVVEEAKDGTKLDQFVITPVGSDFEPPVDDGPVEAGGVFTDGEGLACANLTLGPIPGTNTVQASVSGLPSVAFVATGVSPAIATITKISGDGQTGQQSEVIQPFVVEMRDSQDNLAVGAEVNFEVLAPGNGTISTTNPVIANALGRASTTLTMATNAAVNQVRVTAPGYVGSEVIFTATLPSGDPEKIELAGGDGQVGTAGQMVPNPLQVLVTDADDIPIAGHSVSFRVLDGGGSLDGSPTQSVATNALGIAEVNLTLGTQGGTLNRVEASAPGLAGSPVIISATAALAHELTAVSDINQSGTANLPVADSIEVKILDELGGNLPNHDVLWTIVAGAGFVNGSPQIMTRSNSDGIAKVEWRLGAAVGIDTHTLRAESSQKGEALVGSPVTFTADAVEGPAENLNVVSGDDQTGVALQQLPQPLLVKVTDKDDAAVAGWPVTFAVTAGDGNIEGVSSKLVFTDAKGEAEAVLTLGSGVGFENNKVEASAPQTVSEMFTASARATAATQMTLVEGDGQTGPAGLPLPKKVQVRVTDDDNNNIAGQIVSFRIEGGDGTINGIAAGDTLKNATSNETGIAEVTWYVGGELGSQTQALEIAADDGLSDVGGSPILITATAITGPVDADESTITSDKSAVQANGQDEATITVRLTDRFGNPVSSAVVTLTSDNSGDTIGQPPSVTDANGEATGTISSTAPGTRQVGASGGGVTLNHPVELVFLTVTPEKVALQAGNNQTGNVGTVLPEPLQVLVTDEFDNPVPGITVEFDVTGGGGFILDESVASSGGSAVNKVTDASGIARASWVLGANPGSNLVEAKAVFDGTELNGSPIGFSATGATAVATTLSLFSGNEQAGGAGAPLPEPLQVKVTDASGLPVAGVTVNFDILSGGGSLSTANTSTDYQGIASSVLTLGPEVGTNRARARAPEMSGQPAFIFTAEGLSGTPSRLTRVDGHNGTAVVNSNHSISVLVTDLNDNPIEGVVVDFEVVTGGATMNAPSATTDAGGIAEAEVRMPFTAGDVIVRSRSVLLSNFFVDFIIHGVSGPAVNIDVFAGNNQDGTVGRELVLPLQVFVSDVFGNPVSAHPVTWVADSGNSVSAQNSVTGENGVASTGFTIVNFGENSAEARANGLTGSPVVFTASGVGNNFPVFVDIGNKQVSEGNLLQFVINATDADGDAVTYEAEDVPAGAGFNGASGSFTWIPSAGQHGDYQVTFIARDGRGGLDVETVMISVSNSNNPPVLTQFIPEQSEVRFITSEVILFSVTVTDADNDDLNYSWFLFKGESTDGQEVSQVSSYVMDTGVQEPASYTVRVTISDGKDEISHEWKIDVVTSVELTSFAVDFEGFDGARVSWATSRETNNSGFNVLRSLTQGGEYEKLNSKLIPSSEERDYVFVDRLANAGRRFYYKLEDVDVNGVKTQHGPIAITVAAPETFALSQNFPNPFNPETRIRYQLPRAGEVTLKIFDLLGREVLTLVSEQKDAGFHVVTWNARNSMGAHVSSGVYYYQIVSGDFRHTRKMILVK